MTVAKKASNFPVPLRNYILWEVSPTWNCETRLSNFHQSTESFSFYDFMSWMIKSAVACTNCLCLADPVVSGFTLFNKIVCCFEVSLKDSSPQPLFSSFWCSLLWWSSRCEYKLLVLSLYVDGIYKNSSLTSDLSIFVPKCCQTALFADGLHVGMMIGSWELNETVAIIDLSMKKCICACV